ncbi:MAG: glutamine synthetase family protein [Oscillospiraceae bacterium]|nr:glutamine synthetase family protein [Oscillospiraceae bacterium]MDD3260813.1 glutamine synthetase family protein [Oscillospiraceae bacterium]
MNYTRSEVMQYVEDNDVKFIRLAFCDIHGMQKNVAIMPCELDRAFDTGVGFDASFVRGFMNEVKSDLFLVPDPSTFTVMPWRPSHGQVVRLFCDVRYPDGKPFEGDCRSLLKSAVRQARSMHLSCKVGTACEFYLFKTDENGDATQEPYDFGTYCDTAPRDKCEDVRREICLALEAMGLRPETSRHEEGPGQNEIDFRHSDILSSADNFIAFKGAVKSIAEGSGLYASFMPKPLPGFSGSSLRINISLTRDGENLFQTTNDKCSPLAESFMAGVLRRVSEITLFLNPITNSYERFGCFEAPKFVTWSHQNRSQLIRIPSAPDPDHARMELRSTDPACNPHLAFALLLWAGLEGIQDGLQLPPAENRNLFDVPEEETANLEQLPANLYEALQLAEKSDFIRKCLPEKLRLSFLEQKRREWERYRSSGNGQEFERREYFLTV